MTLGRLQADAVPGRCAQVTDQNPGQPDVQKPDTLAAALSAATLSAQAALVARPGGMVCDDVQNITWLQNWNTNGLMDWNTANDWANNLVHGGFDDWRLPIANTTASSNCSDNFDPGGGFPLQYYGINCTGSEMGHMYYNEFGATANIGISSSSNAANLALFSSVQSDHYWFGTEYAPNPSYPSAWYFGIGNGMQNANGKGYSFSAVAVRPGDVAAVPEPQAWAMVLLGLGAVAVAMRRRPR